MRPVTINLEVAGNPADFNEDDKKNIANGLASQIGVDPSRVVVDIAPAGATKASKGSQMLNLLQAQAEPKMMLLITIKGEPTGVGTPASALAGALAAVPVAKLSAATGLKVMAAPRVITPADEQVAMDQIDAEFNGAVNKNKAKVDEAKKLVKDGELELQAMKDGLNKEKDQTKDAIAGTAKKVKAAEQEAASKKAEGQAKDSDKLKAIAAKEEEIELKKKEAGITAAALPPAGATFGSDPALLSRERIPAGQPCKVLLQESEDVPWEFREFKGTVACAEGFVCGNVRDIAAISYFKEGSDVSTEMSGTVYYCAPDKPVKKIAAPKA